MSAAIDKLAELDGVDLSRVVTIGHSAGGHLAAWAATREYPRVPLTGVVSQAGVLDLQRARELRLSNGVVDRFLDGQPTSVASPIERLPMGVPTLLTHGALDDVVPLEISERFARASGATLVVEPNEDHDGHLDAGQPAVEGRHRMALTREDAQRARRPRSAGAVPRPLRDRRRAPAVLRWQFAGPAAEGRPGAPASTDRRVGRAGRQRLAGLDRRADPNRRCAGRGAGRPAGPGARHRLRHGQPLQARARAARCGPVAAGPGDGPRELPDRPLRPGGDRPRARASSWSSSIPPIRCSARSRTTSRAAHSSSCRMSGIARARSPTWRPSTRSRP